MKRAPNDEWKDASKFLNYHDKAKKQFTDLGSPVALLAAAIAGVDKFDGKGSWNDEEGFVDQVVYANVDYFITKEGVTTWNFRDTVEVNPDGSRTILARAFSPYTISEEEAEEIQKWFKLLYKDLGEDEFKEKVKKTLTKNGVPESKKIRDLSYGHAKKVRDALKAVADDKDIDLSAN
jgi:hypothetical protein